MSEPIIVDCAGLQLSNNTFSASPPGSLSKADNLIINQKGVGQCRNGQDWNAVLATAATKPFAMAEFQSQILVNYATAKTSSSYGLGYVNSGSITALSGTYNPIDVDDASHARMKFAQAAQFLHFCTTAGPKTLETYNGTPRASGLPSMPDCSALGLAVTGTQLGFLQYNSSVAYRTVLKRTTSTGVSLLSPPSSPFVVSNRLVAAVGGLVRTGGTTVTATVSPGTIWSQLALPVTTGSVITLSPGETDFPAGSYTLTGRSGATMTWASAGGNVSSTVAQELQPVPLAVVVTVELPTAAIAGDVVQIYRSIGTSLATINPSDDLYLVAEQTLTAGNIAAKFVAVHDYTPESVLKVPLYTNPTDGDGPGLAGSNLPPPLYHDVATWDSTTWYLNTIGQQYMDLEMLGVGSPDGIQDGDTLTFSDTGDTVYRFTASPSSLHDVQLVSDGTPAYNIAWTTYFFTALAGRQLRASGILVRGGTAPNGYPGGIRIERTNYSTKKFSILASRPASWTPALSAAVGTDSSSSEQPNGLVYSKLAQPEAVPVTNYLTVGASSWNADRLIPLRNALLIFKEGDGIWSLTGTAGNYSLNQISTANIIAPDCCAQFADQAWVYTDQGLLRVSDTGGVTVISRPIDTELNALAAQFPTETFAWSFAIPYEIERRIMFFVPFAAATSSYSSVPLLKAWCYSLATNAWTGPFSFPTQTVLSGVVSTAHRLWLGTFDATWATARITKERKDVAYTDFADGSWSNTLATTADPLIITLTTAGNIDVGDGITQTIGGRLYRTKISAVNDDGTYTVAETVPWTNGTVTIYDRYPVEVQYLPQGHPATRQTLTRLATLYKPDEFSSYFGLTVLQTDQIQADLEIATPFMGFGSTPFGTGPFGNRTPQVVDTNPINPQWTNAGQFFPGFRLEEVWTAFKLQGLYMMLERAGGPVGRGK